MEIRKLGKKHDGPRSAVRQKLITLGVVSAVLIALAATAVYIVNKDSVTLREPVLVSMMGDKQEYRGTTRLIYQEEDEEVRLENEGRTLLLSGVPVYPLESQNAVLTRKMTYSNYETGLIRRVNHFAQVSCADGVASIQSGGKKSHQLNGGYLFDGKNTYLFLEPMTVTWGEESLKLAPLSYISVFNRQGFYYFSKEDQEASYVSSGEKAVMAAAEKGGYTLNMSNDIAELDNGKSFLLSPSPDAFELLE